MSFNIHSLTNIIDLGKDGLKAKADELWEIIVRLETEKFDLEERQRRQGYDVGQDVM